MVRRVAGCGRLVSQPGVIINKKPLSRKRFFSSSAFNTQHRNGNAKAYRVKQVLLAIDKLEFENTIWKQTRIFPLTILSMLYRKPKSDMFLILSCFHAESIRWMELL